ncbi:MAG: cysteine hydrolase family protein [Bryobacteraceae bacterium]
MKTVFLDIDTQIDFLFPAGALYVPGAEEIVPNLAALTRHALSRGHQIISTADAHSENDPEFKTWKPHCVAGTFGQHKAAATLTERPFPLVVSSNAGALEPLTTQLSQAKQIIVEKQMLDCFSNPSLMPLLNALQADRFVVYGVATEYCVRCALAGLVVLGKPVFLVTDAIRGINPEASRQVITGFEARGVTLRSTADVFAGNWL